MKTRFFVDTRNRQFWIDEISYIDPAMPDPRTPEFAHLTDLLLLLSEQRSVDGVVQTFARELVARRPHVARLCVWLEDEHEQGQLALRAACRQEGEESLREWTHASGDYTRVPKTEPIIGRVFQTDAPVFARHRDAWPERPAWADMQNIESFYAAPIRHRGHCFGVLGSFLRYPFTDDGLHDQALAWTRVFADHCGAMIANAQAFEEIEHLRDRLKLENEYLREQDNDARGFGGIVGESPSIKKAIEQIRLVAGTDAGVLVLGESGTGKELFARAVHESSPRRDRPLIRVNCAAVPRELFESEFFGHKRGSFTGAIADRTGRFELADGGTLFLDEIGEIPLELQGKLLRVLQEGTFERIGDTSTIEVDVRIVAATNRDLREEVAAGRFREDLYYRLSVFPVLLPPLRDRGDDIEFLANTLVSRIAHRFGRPTPRLTREELDQLRTYHWPGNIRELQNVIERAVITTPADAIAALHQRSRQEPSRHSQDQREDRPVLSYQQLRELERSNLVAAMKMSEGKVAGPGGAAELLGLPPTTLHSKLRTFAVQNHRDYS
ncbi:MAG: sigma 54-interacting transcriptional regulator [Phycisphaerales bacterium]